MPGGCFRPGIFRFQECVIDAPPGFDVTRWTRLDVGPGGAHVTVLDAFPVSARASRAPRLPQFTLVGALDAPVVVVLGGISAGRHVISSAGQPGWWEAIVGDGRAIDTKRFRVLGIDFVDGGRDAAGRPCRVVTTHDQARWLMNAIRSSGADRVHAIVGSSYGGMIALAFAERFGTRVDRLVVVSAAHESTPMSTALRTLQRRIVELGLETGRADDAMGIARGLAMTTYRTASEFSTRFATAPRSVSHDDARFEVDEYLRDRGARFAAIMPPHRFLALSLSTDLHCVDPRHITVPTTLVAAEGDTIVPRDQMETLAARLGGPSNLVHLPTRVGHDAFLVETDRVSSIVSAALTR